MVSRLASENSENSVAAFREIGYRSPEMVDGRKFPTEIQPKPAKPSLAAVTSQSSLTIREYAGFRIQIAEPHLFGRLWFVKMTLHRDGSQDDAIPLVFGVMCASRSEAESRALKSAHRRIDHLPSGIAQPVHREVPPLPRRELLAAS
jgi:hypothetical protein